MIALLQTGPQFSPDGKEIVFEGLYDSVYAVHFVDLSGNYKGHILSKRDFLSFPTWSPDGTKIAFASQSLNSKVNLWLMDSTGSNLRQLATEGMSYNSGLLFSWNPTEALIVSTQYCLEEWPPQNGTLWILNVNTGQKRQLTFNPKPTNQREKRQIPFNTKPIK